MGWPYAISFLVVFPLISFVCYFITFSPQRIENNLGLSEGLGGAFKSKLKKHVWVSIAVVTTVGFLLIVPRPFQAEGALVPYIFGLSQFFLIYFIGKDFLDNLKFLQSVDDCVCIGEFDNVHLMTAAKGLLEKEGIQHHVRGYELRRLYSFINPLYKMSLLIKTDDAQRARSLIGIDSAKIV